MQFSTLTMLDGRDLPRLISPFLSLFGNAALSCFASICFCGFEAHRKMCRQEVASGEAMAARGRAAVEAKLAALTDRLLHMPSRGRGGCDLSMQCNMAPLQT